MAGGACDHCRLPQTPIAKADDATRHFQTPTAMHRDAFDHSHLALPTLTPMADADAAIRHSHPPQIPIAMHPATHHSHQTSIAAPQHTPSPYTACGTAARSTVIRFLPAQAPCATHCHVWKTQIATAGVPLRSHCQILMASSSSRLLPPPAHMHPCLEPPHTRGSWHPAPHQSVCRSHCSTLSAPADDDARTHSHCLEASSTPCISMCCSHIGKSYTAPPSCSTLQEGC